MDPYLIRVFGEEFESRESFNANLLHLILCGVHLGDEYFVVIFEVLGKLLPNGSQLVAMATPRSIWEAGGRKTNKDK